MSDAACHASLSATPSLPAAAAALAQSPMPRVDASPALLALNDPLEWPAFSKELMGSGGLWESQVVVQGMHCAACAMTVEQLLRQVNGVRSARVSAASQRASVTWDSARVLPAQWMGQVQTQGYALLPANDAFAIDVRRKERRAALWRWLVAGLCMMQVMMYAYPAYTAALGDLSREMEQLLRWARTTPAFSKKKPYLLFPDRSIHVKQPIPCSALVAIWPCLVSRIRPLDRGAGKLYHLLPGLQWYGCAGDRSGLCAWRA